LSKTGKKERGDEDSIVFHGYGNTLRMKIEPHRAVESYLWNKMFSFNYIRMRLDESHRICKLP